MSEDNMLFFKAKLCAAASDPCMANGESRTDDRQGVVLKRFKGSWLSSPQTWRSPHLLAPSHSYQATVILPPLFNDPAPILALDLKTEALILSPSRCRRRAFLHLV